MKTWLIVLALGLLASLFLIGWREDEPHELIGAGVPGGSRGPSFEVRVVVPRLGLALLGIFPDSLVERLKLTPRELRFDSASPGAEIGLVAPDRLELRGDGWDLTVVADGEGRIAPGTHLEVATALGGNEMTLRCQPADPATGHLRTTPRAGADELGGTFLVELATCADAETGKALGWPPAPLSVTGIFDRLSRGAG